MITKSPMNRMVVSMVGSCSWPLRIGAVDGDHILVDLTHLARAGLLTLSLVLLTIRAGARCGRAGILLGCHLVVHEEVRRRTGRRCRTAVRVADGANRRVAEDDLCASIQDDGLAGACSLSLAVCSSDGDSRGSTQVELGFNATTVAYDALRRSLGHQDLGSFLLIARKVTIRVPPLNSFAAVLCRTKCRAAAGEVRHIDGSWGAACCAIESDFLLLYADVFPRLSALRERFDRPPSATGAIAVPPRDDGVVPWKRRHQDLVAEALRGENEQPDEGDDGHESSCHSVSEDFHGSPG